MSDRLHDVLIPVRMCGSLGGMTMTRLLLTLTDGRRLDVFTAGDETAPVIVNLHGTPDGHVVSKSLLNAAATLGLRIVSIARPGYAGSTRLTNRTVSSVVPDVLEALDALGVQRFAVIGASGGGPHALACGALARGRCMAVAVVAGVGPWAATGLDFLAGMGEDNEVEFAAAVRGEIPLRKLLLPWREDMTSAGPEGTFSSLQSVLSTPDQAVLTGAVAEHFHESVSLALHNGVDGWIDDDLAFTRPWGFDLGNVDAPVFLWQGEQDLMVPPAHGRWLANALPHCQAVLLPDDGHLTLMLNRADEILADLAAALADAAAAAAAGQSVR